jgi:hypothetical protein
VESEAMTKLEISRKTVAVLTKEGANKVAIFGSYARGEPGPDSDLDILVEFSSAKSLLDIVRIERVLSEALGVRVDLLTEKSLSPYLADRIKGEMEIIYQ